MVGLHSPAQSFREAGCADGHQHELLDVDVVVGVLATVEHVHHGNGKHVSVRSAYVAIERNVQFVSCRVCGGERDAKDGVCPAAALVRRSVGVDHGRVDVALRCHRQANNGLGEVGVDKANGCQHALALVTVSPVAQFDSFELAGGCTAWHQGPAGCS